MQQLTHENLEMKRQGQLINPKSRAVRRQRARLLLELTKDYDIPVVFSDEKIFRVQSEPNRYNEREVISVEVRTIDKRQHPANIMGWVEFVQVVTTYLRFLCLKV